MNNFVVKSISKKHTELTMRKLKIEFKAQMHSINTTGAINKTTLTLGTAIIKVALSLSHTHTQTHAF